MADADFSFAWEKAQGPGTPWGHMQVARLRGHEAISAPYRYELTLLCKAPAPEVDPRDLLGMRATLRIRTQSEPRTKVVHGVVVEAEELFEVQDGVIHRVVLMPPWARAMHRKRCRIFLDKTLRQIIDAVLQGDPLMHLSAGAQVEEDDGITSSYAPAREIYTWRVRDASRLDDKRVRSYVVQYNESDFDFVSRLLEEEGIGYHFENGNEACLLVLSDSDAGKSRLAPGDVLSSGLFGREVKRFKLGARLRPTSVVLDDHNWKKPKLEMTALGQHGGGDLAEYHYPGGYPDSSDQGKPLAAARIERYQVEATYAAGEGSVRVLSAGSIFKLEHEDADHEGEYLVTGLSVRGEQQGIIAQASDHEEVPWVAQFELARRGAGSSVSESLFRPARRTPKPRVLGAQTAIVTADPSASGAEVNVGGPDGLSIGCVRVRFRWDTEAARLAKEPSSTWVRVSQIFAGAGQGAVYHPRVGDEVLVDHDEGDPDRPVVVGRVYNGANLPPRNGPPESSMKSLSTPGGGTYNEINYDDTAGSELLHYFAGKDQTTDVANFRRESVVANATMTVGSNNSETIGANRSETVAANDTLTVGSNQSINVGANSTHLIGANFTHTVGANEANTVGGSQAIDVGANLTETVGAAVLESYGASRTTTVGGAVSENFGASMSVNVGGNVDEKCASHSVTVGASRLMMIGGNYSTVIGGANTSSISGVQLEVSGGPQTVTAGGTHHRSGPIHVSTTGFDHDIRAAHMDAQATNSTKAGLSIEAAAIVREVLGLKSTTGIVEVKANGIKDGKTGAKLTLWGVCFVVSAAELDAGGETVDA